MIKGDILYLVKWEQFFIGYLLQPKNKLHSWKQDRDVTLTMEVDRNLSTE